MAIPALARTAVAQLTPAGIGLYAVWLSAALWIAPAAQAGASGVTPGDSADLRAEAQDGSAETAPSPPAPATAAPPADQHLFGELGGLRPLLEGHGISLSLSETSEVLGNLTGGVRTGFAYDGLTQMAVQLDTAKAFGWPGGTFRASALQIHGRNLSTDNLLTLQTASGIEALPATRLWELWYQQELVADDRLDIRLGQQSLDQEFLVSDNALLFINTAFGWPIVPSEDLPGGGPAYPLSALGVRLRAHPIEPVTALVAVTNGSPAPNGLGDAQRLNPSGTSFPLNGGVLVFGEFRYAAPAAPPAAQGAPPAAAAGTYKLGLWYDSEDFDDVGGQSAAGLPLRHHGEWGLYGVVDRPVWRSPGGSTLNVFGRAMGAPQADRNLVVLGLNAGVTLHRPFPGRDADAFGLAMGHARVSAAAATPGEAVAGPAPSLVGTRTGETFIEVTYQYQLTPAVQLQPDFQYVFNPGGGIPNPNEPNRRVGDEAVIGLRINVTF